MAKKRKKVTKKDQFTVGCLFAGMGGFCKAFEQAGAETLWANEADNYAVKTFERNYPKVRCIHKDVRELKPRRDRLEPVDILTAGFPCQPFSLAGETLGLKDERGTLFEEIVRVVKEFGKDKPKIILMENVENLQAHDNGTTMSEIVTRIKKSGYFLDTSKYVRVLNTSKHTDIPQNRSRIFLVAFRRDVVRSTPFAWPDPVDKLQKVDSFLDRNKKQDDWYYYTAEKHPRWYPMFVDEFDDSGKKSICMLRRSYVRASKSGLCPTLMANMGEGGHNQPTIKDRWGIRKLTERECARLQGYRNSWLKIPRDTPRAQIYKQIGNSVTVPLVKKIAKECVRQLAEATYY